MLNFTKTACAALISSSLLCASALAETVDVTFLLINDIDTIEEDDAGGFARVAAVVNAERSGGGNVVLVHGGDSISPSVLSGIDEGEHIVKLLNELGIDAMVPGNHEFDFGPDTFRKRIGEMNFDVVGANLREADGSSIAGMDDNKMFTFGDVKIGLVGLTSDDAKEKSSPGDIQFADSVDTLKSQADALKEQGADLIVALAHAPRSEGYDLAGSRAADLVFTGDNHDLLLNYDGRTVFAEAREQGEFIPAIDVSIEVSEDDGERDVDWTPSFRVISTLGMDPDPAVQAMIGEFEAQLAAELDVVIGKTTTELDSRRATIRTQEAAMGNLIADAMKAASGADVALTNGGGIRADKIYEAGTDITRRDILSELPFGNSTVVVELTGAQIEEALENGVSAVEDVAGRFPHVSGMKAEVDLSKASGDRVGAVMINGAPLDPAATYSLATNDFLLRGGDGYHVFTKGKPIIDASTGNLMANDVMAYVREKGDIAPEVEGRIVLSQ